MEPSGEEREEERMIKEEGILLEFKVLLFLGRVGGENVEKEKGGSLQEQRGTLRRRRCAVAGGGHSSKHRRRNVPSCESLHLSSQ